MKGTPGTDEDITAEVYGGMLLACRFLVTAGLRWRFGLGGPNQVAMDHDILLNHTLASKNDVSASSNCGSPTDFVSCFLRRPSVARVGVGVGISHCLNVFSTDRRLGGHSCVRLLKVCKNTLLAGVARRTANSKSKSIWKFTCEMLSGSRLGGEPRALGAKLAAFDNSAQY